MFEYVCIESLKKDLFGLLLLFFILVLCRSFKKLQLDISPITLSRECRRKFENAQYVQRKLQY